MEANEFVKKHGLGYVKSIVLQFPNHTHVTDDARMFINEETCLNHIKSQLNETVKIDDLKRLVESSELANRLGGVDTMRIMIEQMEINDLCDGMNISFDGEWQGVFTKGQLQQAIADMESCQ